MNKNNTSGYKGVSFDKAANKYRAYADICGDKFRLGYFTTASEAYSRRESFIGIFKNSPAPILTYINFKFPQLTTSQSKAVVVVAAGDYLNSKSNLTFFVFCKKYVQNLIKNNAKIPTDFEGFQTILNNDFTKRLFVFGEPISSIQAKSKLQYSQLVSALKCAIS